MSPLFLVATGCRPLVPSLHFESADNASLRQPLNHSITKSPNRSILRLDLGDADAHAIHEKGNYVQEGICSAGLVPASGRPTRRGRKHPPWPSQLEPGLDSPGRPAGAPAIRSSSRPIWPPFRSSRARRWSSRPCSLRPRDGSIRPRRRARRTSVLAARAYSAARCGSRARCS
mgnify:CR=1 FL=1